MLAIIILYFVWNHNILLSLILCEFFLIEIIQDKYKLKYP